MIEHVQYKGIVSCLARSKATGTAETVIIVELVGGTPLCGERRIGNHGIELGVTESVRLQGVAILYLEITELDTMQQHIHTAQVVSSGVFLLPEYLVCPSRMSCTNKQ